MDNDIGFTAEDVLIMAEQMERNGAMFYRDAADRAKNEKTRELFLALAGQENQHEKHFTSLKEIYRERLKIDPAAAARLEEVAADFLRLWLDGEVLERMKKDAQDAIGSGKPAQIIRMAMQMESDAINFYTGFFDLVEKEEDRNIVKTIISDERQHFIQLNRQLEALSPPKPQTL